MIGASIATGMVSTGKTEYSFPNGTQGYSINQNNFSFGTSPSIGWFINDRSVMGATLLFNISHQKTWMESDINGATFKRDIYHNTDFGLGGFFRYYFKNADRYNLFTQLYLNGGSGTTKTNGFHNLTNWSQTYSGESSDRLFYNAGLNLGAAKMLTPALAVEGMVGFVHSFNKFTTTTNSVTNDAGTIINSEYQPTQKFNSNGVNFVVGLQIFLNRK